jgi:hypothetical protein
VVGGVVRAAWSRLVRKQLLFVYPFVLGLLEALAFLAVYSAAGGHLGWSAFASANATPWSWLQDSHAKILSSPLTIAVALLAGVAVCILAAAIRAPFFYAIAGTGYPLSPRSPAELGRLSLFYLIFNGLLYVVPFSFPPDSIGFQIALFVVLAAGALLVFADYAVVFEELMPLQAMARSVGLVRKSWPITLGIFVIAQLVWTGLAMVYSRYYQDGNQIFVLLPISEILLSALLTTVFDILFISLYAALRRDNS